MPYIAREDRTKLDTPINELIELIPKESCTGAGELTYVIFRLLKALYSGKYWTRALGMGCLVCAGLEWYRTTHTEAELVSIQENGNIPD